MKLEYYSEQKLKKEIRQILGTRLDLSRYRVFFFGSRVGGRADHRADVDVGIEGPEAIPWEIMAHIREDFENLPTLYTIDVVDFAAVSPDFRTIALRHTEYLI